MLKKRLGIEAIEKRWRSSITDFFKISPNLIIPEGCREIGGSAFYCCRKLEKVVIPESVEWIADDAFCCCMDAEIILRKHKSEFKYISPDAFLGCRSIYVKEETGTRSY